jgi:hypothetical protein
MEMCAKSLVSRLISITSIFEKKKKIYSFVDINKNIWIVVDEKKSGQ